MHQTGVQCFVFVLLKPNMSLFVAYIIFVYFICVCSVRGRNKDRTAQRTGGGATAGTTKVGYAPRSNLANMKASGLSSSGGRKEKEELDEESKAGLRRIQANDREIDQGINSISNTLDNLTGIAGQMKEEVCTKISRRASIKL